MIFLAWLAKPRKRSKTVLVWVWGHGAYHILVVRE